jgi:hypothetical protein
MSEDDDDSVTRSDEYRWKYLSTVVTVLVVGSYCILVLGDAYGVTEAITGGTWATYSLAFLAVVAYSVGVDTVREAQRMRNGGG